MADMMTFPNTWEEYEKIYGFNDIDQVYTNGSRLIPSFRVKQWLDHEAEQTERSDARKFVGYVCETCKYKDEDWDSEACDGCCGNNNHYEQTEPSFKVDEIADDDPTIHAIAYLQKVGWLQEHDKALTEPNCDECKHNDDGECGFCGEGYISNYEPQQTEPSKDFERIYRELESLWERLEELTEPSTDKPKSTDCGWK